MSRTAARPHRCRDESRDPRGRRPTVRAARVCLLALLLGSAGVSGATPDAHPIQILGNSALDEDFQKEWVAVLTERPIASSADGYRPQVPTADGDKTPIPTDWERPVEFRWNFGDGSGWISTGERPSVAHVYPDDGAFTILVEAWSQGVVWGRGAKPVTVRNKRPLYPMIAATEIDPETHTFELTADVDDAADDEITYRWDFGDHETLEEGGSWRETHAYRSPGTYTATVRMSDDDEPDNFSEKSTEIVVAGVGGGETDSEDPLEGAPAGAVETGFGAKVSGSFNFDLKGTVRPMAGLYLGPVNHGRNCRFLFTAWDDAHLAHVEFVADLPGRPRPGGARYTLRNPRVWVNLDPTGEVYEKLSKRLLFAGLLGGSLGADPRLAGAGAELDPEVRRQIGDATGYEPGPAREVPPSGAPAASPFGLEDHEGFKTASGQVDLVFVPHDRATGSFEIELVNADEKSSYPVLSLSGEFALDLETAARDGMVLYDRCATADFAVVKTSPEDGRRHLVTPAPRVGVQFSDRFDVRTLDDSTFQLTYPAAGSRAPIPVAVRMFRKRNVADIEPVQPLWGGVRYTARVRTGEQGVRSLAGVPLEDEDGSGWHTWSFTTKIDFVPGPEDGNLACHVFQSVRDAPLIAGKRAVARIYADWKPHPAVDASAQVDEFTARVLLVNGGEEIASLPYRFVRPDLWSARGIELRKAEHTANLFWTPEADLPDSLRVALEVPTGEGDEQLRVYWTRCATPHWDLAPEIRIAWFITDSGPWHELHGDDELVEVERYIRPIVERAKVFARQIYPFKEVHVRFGGVLRDPRLLLEWTHCTTNCVAKLLEGARAGLWPGDEVAIGFVPQIEGLIGGLGKISGGGAKKWLGPGVPGIIGFAIEPRPEYADRYVYGIVHELGHVLGLQHLPFIRTDFQQHQTTVVRDECWEKGGTHVLEYKGIEGFRIASDGRSGWNKSSTEGNEQGSWIVPIMYPSTIPIDDAFIARQHYLQLMKTFDEHHGLPGP